MSSALSERRNRDLATYYSRRPPRKRPSYPTWVTDELLRDYYDTEWGMPVTDERGLFEALSSRLFRWALVAHDSCPPRGIPPRFQGFDPERVAAFTDHDVGAAPPE